MVTLPIYRTLPGPLAIAHRGGAGLAAENTFEAFARSHALGIRYLETDVRLTRDGELVIFHDAQLRRATGREGRVGDHSLAELSAMTVLGSGRVISLREALTAFADTCFVIDVKEAAAVTPLADLLRELGAGHRVCAAASHGSWLRALSEATGPELSTALPWRHLVHLALRGPIGHGQAAFAHLPLRLGRVPVFRDDLVARAHDAGIRVIVWTVDDPDTMHRLLDHGVDGIITDRPDVLREVLIARDQWHAPNPRLGVVHPMAISQTAPSTPCRPSVEAFMTRNLEGTP
ncbi:glycerophosphodiester phosphodiesterase family protein [Aeromicrobium sp. CF3.5]|uniref:glycerophosphodiester phosphodiesterase family protein n=1 Tax=Aeromicrobium sp. CF3.5 TaxID=3373078 RepID=UPI003EE78666